MCTCVCIWYVCVYVCACICTCMCTCICICTCLSRLRFSRRSVRRQAVSKQICLECRGKLLHTRNQHLGNHRGLSVAFSNGFEWQVPKEVHFSVVCSKGLSLAQWNSPGIVQWMCTCTCQWNFTCVISGVWYVVPRVVKPLFVNGRHDSVNSLRALLY